MARLCPWLASCSSGARSPGSSTSGASIRRATEAARAEIAASEWGRRAIVTSLVSQVGSLYFDLRALDLELEISERTLASREESLRLTVIRERGGVTPLVDVRQAEQLVFSARGQIVDVRRRIEQDENALSVLLGQNPGPIARGRTLTEQTDASDCAGRPPVVAPRAAAGYPAGRAADGRGQRAHRRGEGRVLSADLADRVWRRREHGALEPLHGRDLGRSAPAWSNRSSTPAETARRWRSPRRGARRASSSIARRFSRRSARCRTRSSATAGCASSAKTQASVVVAARDARRLADLRYQGGATSYLEVLDSDTRLFVAELGLVQAQLAERNAFVEIYRALGGGWKS